MNSCCIFALAIRNKYGEVLKNTQCENSSVGRAQPCQGWGRGFEPRFSLDYQIKIFARVVELVDTLDLKSSEHFVRAGSSPALSTKAPYVSLELFVFILLGRFINSRYFILWIHSWLKRRLLCKLYINCHAWKMNEEWFCSFCFQLFLIVQTKK